MSARASVLRVVLCPMLLVVACERDAGTRGSGTGSDTMGAGGDTSAAARDAGPDTAGPDTAAPDETALPDDCEGLENSILRAAPNRAALARAFGEPDSLRASTEPNRHMPDATDSLFTVFYPGITVDIRKPSGGDDMPTHVDVLDNRYVAFPAIGVGTSASRVTDALGEPTRRTDRTLVYDCGMGAEQPVTFHLDARSVVERIEISYYVD